ncbi:helicase-associated [Mycobacterium bohemicum DSM 44277]|uniref:Helicase-associated n=1 Tax=Mycobacterium bohemicum DSM 44277 TaxID=1236609 RepID=A0A0U0W7V0_MYCBE|nr:DEAD/DEAH box helicase [Mycobacterium bohemicum]MCV6969806.1 Helicase associated domain protein [Mycobacterium bohemicum]CPR10900.1 helicase-associated [Mycobacterium bohemicum DSM 44277]
MATFSDLFARLDPDARVRGKQFEHVCKWFLINDPTYKNTLRRVWLWNEWTGRWGGDAGIDLVAEDHDGRLWAIQAKAYAPENTVTKADVDKFLAESSRAVFSYRLLIATTDKLHHVARRTINDQEKQVAFVGLSDLLTSEVNWRTKPFDMRPSSRPKPAKPREHQREAIRDVVKGFTKSDRGQLIMACGTGKTLTSLFIKEKLDAERTLVLVPSLSLLKQTIQVWQVNARVPFEALPVCSDQTVGRNEDEAVAHTSELGVPVTTDAAEIARFLRRPGPRVVFSTYQSSPQIAEAFALGRVPPFDLAVADEAHRVAGFESSDFSTVLDKTAIAARRRLFMTATPRYFTGRVLKAAQDADLEVASMDDQAKFGTVFYRLTFGEAIKRDLLTDYQVVVVGVDDAMYKEWAEKGTLVTRDGKKITDARTLAGQIGLAKAMRKYDLHRTISFHSRVARAREFAAEMHEVIQWMPARQRPKGLLWSSYASGEMTAGERHSRLQHLSRLDDGQRGLLTNARCLSEGVDVPTLDGVAFIDPRRSEVDIVQAVGRAIRRAPDKTIGTVVIPVFIDTDVDPEVALNDSAFKPVWDVIKALRSHNDELAEQLDELRRELGRQGQRPRLPGKIHLDLPARVGSDFALAFDVRLVEQTTASWEYWLGMMQRFVERHGHARVPQSYTVDGYRLGGWVGEQRTNYTEGTLKADRQRRLEDLPGWTWDRQADKWEQGFRRLLEYVERHGRARVPQSYTVDGYRLGSWCQLQRSNYAEGILEGDRKRRLKDLPGWTWDPRADDWEEGFSRLLDFVDRHGRARVPLSHTVDGYKLGQWVSVQRTRRDKGTLEADRQHRLQDLPGWTWQPRADQWEEGFERLLGYVDRHRHARVPRSCTVDGYRLGAWVNGQRNDYSHGTLDADRKRRLEELPGWTWDARAKQWEDGFRRLVDYVERNGDARIPVSYQVDGYPLGEWANMQRDKHFKGTLDKDHCARLEAVPGWVWSPLDAQWEARFRRLLVYIEAHGDSRVPQSYKADGYNLGNWVSIQRGKYAKGTLDPDRRQRLEELPTWTWTATDYDRAWEDGLRLLQEYMELHGDSLVPQSYVVDGYKLGSWATVQRHKHAKGILDTERERRLEALPGWFWDARAAEWEAAFGRLEGYVGRHGDAFVPQNYTVDGYKLGKWVNTQRVFRSRDRLDPERQRRLEALPGWTWDSRQAAWDKGFRYLQEYVKKNGHARVPQSYVVDGFRLGNWINMQRSNFSNGILEDDRRLRLEGLPGWSWPSRRSLAAL